MHPSPSRHRSPARTAPIPFDFNDIVPYWSELDGGALYSWLSFLVQPRAAAARLRLFFKSGGVTKVVTITMITSAENVPDDSSG